MSRPAYHRLSRALTPFFPLVACLLCAAGCNNSCVSGTLNSPSGSTINVKIASPPPSCTLTTANGVVHLEIGVASGSTSPPGAIGLHITHLFVTVVGVDVHPSALADDDTPGWQPLAAPPQAFPVQVDLLAPTHASGSSAPLPDAVLPAGVYRQIRLRLAIPLPDQPGLVEPVFKANPCGPGSARCAVMSDGRIQPLSLSPSRPNFRILSESIPGHDLYVPPDGVVTLRIEFDQDHSWVWSSGDSLLLAPIFHLSVQ